MAIRKPLMMKPDDDRSRAAYISHIKRVFHGNTPNTLRWVEAFKKGKIIDRQ
jgi:hypothetical protein